MSGKQRQRRSRTCWWRACSSSPLDQVSHILLQAPAADGRLRVWDATRRDWQAEEENGKALLNLPAINRKSSEPTH
jgi:hypothetical protein